MFYDYEICDEKLNRTMYVSERGDVLFSFSNFTECEVLFPTVHYITMTKPTLFQSGNIVFFNESDKSLVYDVSGEKQKLLIMVTKKQKATFEAIYRALKRRGYRINYI